MAPYSKELCREVLAAYDRGEGTRAVALRFNCGAPWVRSSPSMRVQASFGQVQVVYPNARVAEIAGGLQLYSSPAPIKRTVIYGA